MTVMDHSGVPSLSASACRMCGRCQKNPRTAELHPCPFQVEINDLKDRYCDCCDDCCQECSDMI